VHIVVGDEFDSLIKGARLKFIPLGINIQADIESHTNIFRFMVNIKDKILKASAKEQDAIVATFIGVGTCPLARSRKIPFFYAVSIPGLQTREFP
jgi:hypothetical protein